MEYSLKKIYSEPTLDEGLFSFFEPISTTPSIDAELPLILAFRNNASSSQWNIQAQGTINFALDNQSAQQAWNDAIQANKSS